MSKKQHTYVQVGVGHHVTKEKFEKIKESFKKQKDKQKKNKKEEEEN